MQISGIEITHPDKVLFPDDGITKLDIARYYEKIASKIIPFLKNRPVSLVRSPAGINEGRFYQKHPSENFPDYIDRVKIKEKSGETGIYIEIDALNDLLFLANLGTIELHTWLCRVDAIENPDICIIDFDPDSEKLWNEVIDGVLFLKKEAERLGYNPKARVTGGKGIHIVLEYKDKKSWEESKVFAKAFAQKLIDQKPDIFTFDMSKDKRKGKVFLDFYRNERGATAVVPYSVRTKPKATIAKPIEWSEVTKSLKPNQFTIKDFL